MGREKSHLKELLWCLRIEQKHMWVLMKLLGVFFYVKMCQFTLSLDRKCGALQLNWVMHDL